MPTEKAHGLQIVKTCEAFGCAGFEVTLVVPNRVTPISADAFSYYGATHTFKIERESVLDVVRFGYLGFLLSLVWFSERVRMRRDFWDSIIYSRDALVLWQYILLGRTTVYEAHRAPTFIDRMVSRRATRVVVITESLRAAFMRAGVPPARILVAHDAVDVSPEKMERAELGLPEGPLVVYAGSRGAGKGVEVLEQAMPKLTESGISVFLVAGKTPREARQMLAAADVVVVPNSAKNEQYGVHSSPMKLFEALASGARVVASDAPAITEIASEKEAWLFASDDVEDLIRKVKESLADPRALEKVAAAQALAQRYSWDARARTILHALERVNSKVL